MTNLSREIRSAMDTALEASQQEGSVFDVYRTAIEIGETFPDAQIRIDDLVDYMVGHIRGTQAMEISPPRLALEIIFPADDVGGMLPKNSTSNDNRSRRAMIGPKDHAQICSAHRCIEESRMAINASAPMLQLHRPSPLTALATPKGGRSGEAAPAQKRRRRKTG